MKTHVRKNKKLAPFMLYKDEVYHDYGIRIKSNLYWNNFEFIEIFSIFSVRTYYIGKYVLYINVGICRTRATITTIEYLPYRRTEFSEKNSMETKKRT